ncbi:MAG: amino acid ABC transporter permease [Clostridia bacterium]|nr:amino acid ABC transporter permease [Clostridia bacterium]
MQRKIETFIEVFIDEGGYRDVLTGLRNTLLIAVLGLLIGIVIGTMIAAVRVMPKYKRLPRILDSVGRFYVSFFRGTPMVVQLLLFWYVLLPLLGVNLPSLAIGSFVIGPEVWASVIVFGLNSGAYISEIMRGGIQSVDYGQTEGGRSVGLSYGTTMMKIVIPQAVKNILPTMGNEFITLIKETSVVSFIGATDLYKAFNDMGSNTYEFMVPYLAMGIIYILLVSIIALGIKLLERRLARSDRNH